MRKWKAALGMVLAALAAGAVCVGCAQEQVQYRDIHGVDFPVNEAGQTYGSALDANVPEGFSGTTEEMKAFYPDLIRAQNAEGVEGYITLDDFFGEDPPSPEAGATGAYNHTLDGVTLYAQDGKTILGTM